MSLLTATLDATSDGLLVVDNKRSVESFNKKFVDLWKIPTVLIETNDDNKFWILC